MKGSENKPCLHSWCRIAAEKTEYFALFKSDYIMNREGLQTFKLFKTLIDGTPYILPANPFEKGTKENNSFELFRQSEQTFTNAIGYWPNDRDVFDKSEVAFKLIEETISIPVRWNSKDGGEWLEALDLKEVAVYCGDGCDY